MTRCEDCGREMTDLENVQGCTVTQLRIAGEVYDRLPFEHRNRGTGPDVRCHDCNAVPGHYHHLGCDVERCPKCGCQLISCDCSEITPEPSR